jgi:RIO kinase 1
MASDDPIPDSVIEFISGGLVREVLSMIKSGKEASAYLCRAHPSLNTKWAVAKVYHERDRRNFANATQYTDGYVILSRAVRQAIKAKKALGRGFEQFIWVNREYDALCAAFDAGVSVPEPFACTEDSVLMEYVGDGSGPAPQLQSVDLAPPEAATCRDAILGDIATLLAHDIVHADLSPYNILWWKGRPRIIDLPQSVDPRMSSHARRLLGRDVTNVSRYLSRFGAGFDPDAVTDRLWHAWEHDGDEWDLREAALAAASRGAPDPGLEAAIPLAR